MLLEHSNTFATRRGLLASSTQADSWAIATTRRPTRSNLCADRRRQARSPACVVGHVPAKPRRRFATSHCDWRTTSARWLVGLAKQKNEDVLTARRSIAVRSRAMLVRHRPQRHSWRDSAKAVFWLAQVRGRKAPTSRRPSCSTTRPGRSRACRLRSVAIETPRAEADLTRLSTRQDDESARAPFSHSPNCRRARDTGLIATARIARSRASCVRRRVSGCRSPVGCGAEVPGRVLTANH